MRKKVYCYLEEYTSEQGLACRFREIDTGRLVQFRNPVGLSQENSDKFKQKLLLFMSEVRKLNMQFGRTFYNPDTTEDFIAVGGDVMKDSKNVLQFAINKNSEFYIV